MRQCYISKNYKSIESGGNKAKTDIEKIMDSLGFVNLGITQTQYRYTIIGYLITLIGVIKAIFSIKKGDYLVIQYPLKKYYSLLCKVASMKGATIITLIHDLGSFRRKKLTNEKEQKRLSYSHYIIALSPQMKEWLIKNGYTQPIGILQMWDYLSTTHPTHPTQSTPSAEHASPSNSTPSAEHASPSNSTQLETHNSSFEIIYAGILSMKKHSFIYKLDKLMQPGNYNFSIYGKGFLSNQIINKERFNSKGFVSSDQIIATTTGHFGLVWYGHSTDTIDGVYGQWLKLTIPHKTSLYIRCHIPVIVWTQSAQATFVKEHNIGFCINSLEELDNTLATLTPKEYILMKSNTIKLSKNLSQGYYFKQAFLDAKHKSL